jgi:hypothetical protein
VKKIQQNHQEHHHHQILARMQGKKETSYTACGNETSTTTLEKIWRLLKN